MKHNPADKKCRCDTCAAVEGGATLEEALAARRTWEADKLEKFGWYSHFIGGGDHESSPTGLNFHTHGFTETHQHPDFQIVIPLPEKVAHSLFATFYDRVKAGEKFEAGQTVDKIVKDMPVKLMEAKEGDRTVLRIILPDPKGRVELKEINKQFRTQYADLVDIGQPKWEAKSKKKKK